ncbi:MAG: hypothetical protein J0I20_23325 [Chloroflexi bacterium]|nr:hypothetical protein [Chloroflexota bacterium]OJV92169.1 MAG: hypothetical protein BGO39_09645 [Chloroflexi bacterium 54-19]
MPQTTSKESKDSKNSESENTSLAENPGEISGFSPVSALLNLKSSNKPQLTPSNILALQRTIGNQAVARMIEANRVARSKQPATSAQVQRLPGLTKKASQKIDGKKPYEKENIEDKGYTLAEQAHLYTQLTNALLAEQEARQKKDPDPEAVFNNLPQTFRPRRMNAAEKKVREIDAILADETARVTAIKQKRADDKVFAPKKVYKEENALAMARFVTSDEKLTEEAKAILGDTLANMTPEQRKAYEAKLNTIKEGLKAAKKKEKEAYQAEEVKFQEWLAGEYGPSLTDKLANKVSPKDPTVPGSTLNEYFEDRKIDKAQGKLLMEMYGGKRSDQRRQGAIETENLNKFERMALNNFRALMAEKKIEKKKAKAKEKAFKAAMKEWLGGTDDKLGAEARGFFSEDTKQAIVKDQSEHQQVLKNMAGNPGFNTMLEAYIGKDKYKDFFALLARVGKPAIKINDTKEEEEARYVTSKDLELLNKNIGFALKGGSAGLRYVGGKITEGVGNAGAVAGDQTTQDNSLAAEHAIIGVAHLGVTIAETLDAAQAMNEVLEGDAAQRIQGRDKLLDSTFGVFNGLLKTTREAIRMAEVIMMSSGGQIAAEVVPALTIAVEAIKIIHLVTDLAERSSRALTAKKVTKKARQQNDVVIELSANMVRDRDLQLIAHDSVDVVASSLLIGGAGTTLGGVTAPVGLSITALGKAVRLGNRLAKLVIDDNRARKRQDLRKAKGAGKEGAAEELLAHDATYALRSILISAKYDGNEHALSLMAEFGFSKQALDSSPDEHIHKTMLAKVREKDEPMTFIENIKDKAKELKLDAKEAWEDRTYKNTYGKAISEVMNELGYKGKTSGNELKDPVKEVPRLREAIKHHSKLTPERKLELLAKIPSKEDHLRQKNEKPSDNRVIKPLQLMSIADLLESLSGSDAKDPGSRNLLRRNLSSKLENFTTLAPEDETAIDKALRNPTLFKGNDGIALQKELETALSRAHSAPTQAVGSQAGATVSAGTPS